MQRDDDEWVAAQHIVIIRLSGDEDGDYKKIQKNVKMGDISFDWSTVYNIKAVIYYFKQTIMQIPIECNFLS